jgi:hypothetical protein
MVSVAVLGLVFAINLSAGEHKGKQGHMPAFSDFDLDGDGTIVEQEFNEGHAKRMAERAAEGHELRNAGKCTFAGIDADSSGAISPGEFKAHQAQHMGKGKHKCQNKENCKHKHQHKHGQMDKQEEQSET